MLKICTLALLGLLTASGSVACGTGTTGRGNQVIEGSTCTTAVAPASTLPGVRTASVFVPGNAFGITTTSDGGVSFVSLNDTIAVLSNATFPPTLTAQIKVAGTPAEVTLTNDNRYLLVADSSGALVIDAARAERGQRDALLATLSSPHGRGAIGVTLSPDDRFAFVTMEVSDEMAVFDLRAGLQHSHSGSAFVGSVPLGQAPVGVAISPDGRWIYATSEAGSRSTSSEARQGTLSLIELGRAETDPRHAVKATVAAGCSPVRVVPSSDGSEVWVTARGDNAVLGFSANRILTDPNRALDARVSVGSEPVGLLPVDGGHRLVIADSDRSSASGIGPRLDVVDAQSALSGHPALLGSVVTGSFPREMAAIPNSKTLLVTNYGSRQVEAVNLADLP